MADAGGKVQGLGACLFLFFLSFTPVHAGWAPAAPLNQHLCCESRRPLPAAALLDSVSLAARGGGRVTVPGSVTQRLALSDTAIGHGGGGLGLD